MKYIKTFESTVFHTMKQIDEIIDKISELGYEKLDDSEKAILNNFSNDDADIHKILVEMNELTRKFKILNQKMREYKGPGSAKDKYFGIWLELNTKMTELENELRYTYKVENPDDIWIYQDKHGLTTPDYDYDDEYNEGIKHFKYDNKFVKEIFSMVFNKAIKHFITFHKKISAEDILGFINHYMINYYGVESPVNKEILAYIKHLLHKKFNKNYYDIVDDDDFDPQDDVYDDDFEEPEVETEFVPKFYDTDEIDEIDLEIE